MKQSVNNNAFSSNRSSISNYQQHQYQNNNINNGHSSDFDFALLQFKQRAIGLNQFYQPSNVQLLKVSWDAILNFGIAFNQLRDDYKNKYDVKVE